MKIISYSLWGNIPKYIIGSTENLILQRKFYPDWICRFYVHNKVNKKVIKNLESGGAQIVIIDEDISKEDKYSTLGNHKGWFWRFRVLDDTSIERFIVRDVDSRLSIREANCVRDWIYSKLNFHIIRDHKRHSVPICAGMWGATINIINKINFSELLENFKSPHNKAFGGYDQHFLAEKLYTVVRKISCIHDDLDRFNEGARKIPHFKLNPNEYIGKSIEL